VIYTHTRELLATRFDQSLQFVALFGAASIASS
jgi:hypothetical protein